MKLEEYSNMVNEHRMNIFKMKMLLESAMIIFEEFPKNLNSDLKEKWKERIGNMITLFTGIYNGNLEGVENIQFDEIGSNALLFTTLSATNNKDPNCAFNDIFNLQEIISYQALVMNYARIDAFFNDTVKYICELKPGIMLNQLDDSLGKNEAINEKNLTWEKIINLGSYDEIMNFISDNFLFKLGLKSIKDKIIFLNEKVKINLLKEKVKLDLIYEGEQYRHCIVHRGGVIDKRLISIIKKDNLQEGNKLCIDKEYLWEIFNESDKLIQIIEYGIGKKFFKEK